MIVNLDFDMEKNCNVRNSCTTDMATTVKSWFAYLTDGIVSKDSLSNGSSEQF